MNKKILVLLLSDGEEIAREVVTVEESEDTDNDIDFAIQEVIQDWVLSIGSTITITEELA